MLDDMKWAGMGESGGNSKDLRYSLIKEGFFKIISNNFSILPLDEKDDEEDDEGDDEEDDEEVDEMLC